MKITPCKFKWAQAFSPILYLVYLAIIIPTFGLLMLVDWWEQHAFRPNRWM